MSADVLGAADALADAVDVFAASVVVGPDLAAVAVAVDVAGVAMFDRLVDYREARAAAGGLTSAAREQRAHARSVARMLYRDGGDR